jgi:hypothetical protein
MICEKCGFEYEGENCPVCEVAGSKVVVDEPKKSAFGIVGMILGILSFFNGIPYAIASLILSNIGLKRCPTDGCAKAGKTMSIISLIINIAKYVGLLAFVAVYYILIIVAGIAAGAAGSGVIY